MLACARTARTGSCLPGLHVPWSNLPKDALCRGGAPLRKCCSAQFNKHCHLRYGRAVHKMPLEMAATAPAATVDPSVYLPPALRSGLCCAAPCVMEPDPWRGQHFYAMPRASVLAAGHRSAHADTEQSGA